MSLLRGLVAAVTIGVLSSVLACSRASAHEEGWTSDLPAAMARAKAEKKDLLLDFTGSDWCQFCMLLKEEVFDQEAFKKGAPEHFVLVELDFPNDTSQLSEATQKQNEEWRKKLEPSGFPVIFLTDETGRPYAQTGYEPGGVDKYLANLEVLRKKGDARDAALAAAASSTGIEKARHLDDALTAVGDTLGVKFYRQELDEVIKLDAENEAGLKHKYERWLANAEFDKLVNDLKQEFSPQTAEKTLAALDEAIKTYEPDGERVWEAKLFRADIYAAAGRFADMMPLLEELLTHEGFEPTQRVNLGLIKVSLLREAGKHDEAIAFFDEVIPLAGDDKFLKAQVVFLKGRILSLRGRNEEALQLYDEAIAIADDQELKAQIEKAKLQLKLAPGKTE